MIEIDEGEVFIGSVLLQNYSGLKLRMKFSVKFPVDLPGCGCICPYRK